jgi:hypothetical protein
MRVSTAAVCTLAALATGDLLRQAIAQPAAASTMDSVDATVTPKGASTIPNIISDAIGVAPVARPEVMVMAESLPNPDMYQDATAFGKVPLADDLAIASAQSGDPLVVESVVVELAEGSAPAEGSIPAEGAPSPIASEPPGFELAAQDPATATIAPIRSTIVPPAPARLAPAIGLAPATSSAPSVGSISQPETSQPERFSTTSLAIAQASPPTSQNEIEQLQRRLENVSPPEPAFGNEYAGSPAITLSNPSGFGADNFRGFVGLSFQADKRGENGADAALVAGIGLGDARRAVGLQLSYTLASLGSIDRAFGSGGFNAKLHHQFRGGLGVAVGWEGFATIGDPVDFEDSIFGSVTQIIRTRPNIRDSFSRVALTAGVGSGRFRSAADFNRDANTVNGFGSIAVRVAEPVSAVVEWTGQDLAAGISIVPFKHIPFVLTPAVRDLAGAGDRPRFVLGASLSFRF